VHGLQFDFVVVIVDAFEFAGQQTDHLVDVLLHDVVRTDVVGVYRVDLLRQVVRVDFANLIAVVTEETEVHDLFGVPGDD